MKPQTIKSKLVRLGIRQADIARSFDPPISRSAVSMTIRGVMNSAKIQTAVADAIDLPRERVFPKGHKK